MDGVQSSHDEYANSQWADLGNLQHQQSGSHHHSLSSHHQDFGAHYGFVESPGFAPPDSPFRQQPPAMPIAQNFIAISQWGQSMPPPPPTVVTSASQVYSAPQAIAPAPPGLAPAPHLSGKSQQPTSSSSTPRRTLTDADRRRMCIFHEQHPNVKQTEIGAMFGVERSTVSKVLRQKEKYMFPDDGSRSPVKRSKGKFPDIERALSVWARNTRKQGIALTDVMIREKAKFFASSLGISEAQFKANNAGWLEKVRQKGLHPNGRGRSESDATGRARGSVTSAGTTARASHASQADSSPTAKGEADEEATAAMMQNSKSQDSQNTSAGSPDSFIDFSANIEAYKQQQSSGSASTPLSGSFTSQGVLGPESPASPFFPTDSAQPSPRFTPAQQARLNQQQHQQQRPRSQTFPLLNLDPTYISPPPSSEPLTPKMLHPGSLPLASPALDMANSLASPHGTPASSHAALSAVGTPAAVAPTRDDAKHALEVLMSFLRQQPVGFVEPDEFVVVGRLLGKFVLADDAYSSATPDQSQQP